MIQTKEAAPLAAASLVRTWLALAPSVAVPASRCSVAATLAASPAASGTAAAAARASTRRGGGGNATSLASFAPFSGCALGGGDAEGEVALAHARPVLCLRIGCSARLYAGLLAVKVTHGPCLPDTPCYFTQSRAHPEPEVEEPEPEPEPEPEVEELVLPESAFAGIGAFSTTQQVQAKGPVSHKRESQKHSARRGAGQGSIKEAAAAACGVHSSVTARS